MKKLIITIINLYQRYISPLFGRRCRFYPSCSEYMRLSIKSSNPIKGIFLGLLRLMKCNPFFSGGVDFPKNYIIEKRLNDESRN